MKILVILLFNLFVFSQEEIMFQEIIVKEGETLWSIANKYLKNPRAWPEILKYNKQLSTDPHIVLPGMKLIVPVLLVKEEYRIAAQLIFILNRVEYKREKEVKWESAYLKLNLYDNDALRTFEKSHAHVKFISGEVVKMDENSLIMVRPEKGREEVELVDGGVRSAKTRIITPTAIVDPKAKDTDFRAKLDVDKTTIVEVYKGLVDVIAQGKTVTLKGGFGTIVRPLAPPVEPISLPEIPRLSEEIKEKKMDVYLSAMNTSIDIPVAEFMKIGHREDVHKAKAVGELKRKYRLQISKDEGFKKILVDEKEVLKDRLNIDFKKYQLQDGKYYYRIAYIDELGFESDFSYPMAFYVDTTPPKLEIIEPLEEQHVTKKIVHVKGVSEKDASVFINDKKVSVGEDGGFHTAISVVDGRNLIGIKAVDRAGNSTYIERIIYRVEKIGDEVVKKPEPKKPARGISIAAIALATAVGVLIGSVIYFIILL